MERSWKVPAGPPVALAPDEAPIAAELRARFDAIMDRIGKSDLVDPKELDAMGDIAHDLHMRLKKRGHEPKHHKYMLKNREVPPTDKEFYRHVHPVEDLLRFLGNENANDDPVDATIGHEFEFEVFSRRWGHADHYRVKRTAKGWVFAHMQEIPTGRDGRIAKKMGTGLFHLLDHDSINYPEELPGYLEWLWEQAAERGLSHEEVQAALTQLAEWVSLCERSSPAGVFGGYK